MALIRCPNCDTLHDLDGAMFASGPRKVRCASCREVWLASDGAPPREPVTDTAQLAEQLATAPLPPPPAEPPEAPQPDFDKIDIGPQPAPAEPPAANIVVSEAPAGAAQPIMVAPPAAAPQPDDERAQRREERRRNRAAPAAAAPAKRRPPAFAVVFAAAGIGTLLTLVLMRHETARVIPQTAPIFEAFGLSVSRSAFDITDVKSRIFREDDRETLEVTGTLINLSKEWQRLPVLRIALQDGGGREIYVWTATADVPELGPGEKLAFRRRLASPPTEAQAVLVRFLAKDDIVAAIR